MKTFVITMSNDVKGTEDLNEPNINNVFDDILFSEEKIIEESYKQGYSEGKSEDALQGYHLGYHRGAELGSKLGYYLAFCEYHLNENKGRIAEKIVRNLETLKQHIEDFPKTNTEQVDLFQLIEKIQGLYKKICVQLKIKNDFKKEGLQF